MVGLFLIPFMTPLLDDALQGVPRSLREASLSLGANVWNTLKSVTIPYAFPGIMNALLLGILTALGESIIVWFCIGFGTSNLPHPQFDVLQRAAPLTSAIVGLLGGGSRATVVGPIGNSVASFAGLLLLIMAFAILALTFYLQGRIKKRISQ